MSLLRPTYYVSSLPEVEVDKLAAGGIRCILLDRDNTCVPRDTGVIPQEVIAWFAAAHSQGMQLCLVSNNIHGSQVQKSADVLGADCVTFAMKPAPFAIWKALAQEGVPAEQAIMIGDQMLTDMAAGNLAGLRTILIRPQSQVDLWYTQIFRKVEHMLLGKQKFKGEVESEEG